MRGEPAGLVFTVNQFLINLYIKNASPALDQLNIRVVLVFDRRRQTGGLGGVVSLHAVFDADFHERILRIFRTDRPRSMIHDPRSPAPPRQIDGSRPGGVA